MHVNRTRIILIVMIIATVVLGGAAIFIGWRLQTQVNTKSFASCTCPTPQSNWEGPDEWNKCWSRLPGESGVSVAADCDGNTSNSTTNTSNSGRCNEDSAGIRCTSYCNYPANLGCNQIECSEADGGGTVNINGGPASCPDGENNNVDPADPGAILTAPNPTNNCTKPTGYDTPNRQWNCSCTSSQLCDEGNGIKGCYFNCRYTSVTFSTCALWAASVPEPPVCTQYDYTLDDGVTKCYKGNVNNCGTTTTSSSTTTSSTTTSATTQNTCYKCTDSENDGNACQTQTTTGTCASLGAGWTTNTLCETGATGGSCTAAIQAKVRGRVYCQDTNGPIIPISNTVVAITKGSTVINATTDSEGFYVSSNIGLPSTGDKVAVDIASLPTTFNNGLNTSQLTGKSALNCASASSLPGCSTGVASNYYCDSVTTKGSYANCKLTTAGDSTSGHGFFDFKYTNCTATVPSCGNSVVDNGESCDPVGTVGQCTTGGKCQTGCACPTCNSACSTNDDCPDGLVCSNNSCRNPSNKSAVDCKAGTTSVPSTGFIDQNYGVLVLSIVLMLIGLAFVRNQGVISLLTNTAISLFGTNILRYVDPDGAKRYYEKNILNNQKHEVK